MKWAAFEESVNNIEQAREIMRQLITMYPMLLEARMQQIDIERRQKCFEAAEKMYTKVNDPFLLVFLVCLDWPLSDLCLLLNAKIRKLARNFWQ